MSNLIDLIERIEAWNIDTGQMPKDENERIDLWRQKFSYRELAEEIFEEEVMELFNSGDNEVEQLDALADIFYTLVGLVVKAGFKREFLDAIESVISSNESKLKGEVVFHKNGKIGKGSEYFPPDIEGILKRSGRI